MYRMMKKNDCLPYWCRWLPPHVTSHDTDLVLVDRLQLDKDIKKATEGLRCELPGLKEQWHKEMESALKQVPNSGVGAAHFGRFEDSPRWKSSKTQQRLAGKVKEINSMILNFNLAAPHMNFQKFFVELDQELAGTSLEGQTNTTRSPS